MNKSDYFSEQNQISNSIKTINSPSGKYKLLISSYKTNPGSWNYSQGKVFDAISNNPISIVNRNYSSFPFLFVEDHPNGHDYLICGEDYQGQTVIELDTGKRKDYLPKEASEGFAFCCGSFLKFDTQSKLLLVNGCYWACPYEFKFLDFSNPVECLKFLEATTVIYDDAMSPSFEPDGTIKAYEHEFVDSDDDEDPRLGKIRSHSIFKRDGDKLELISEFVTEEEKARRIASKETDKKNQELVNNYKANNPIWLKFQELIKYPPFEPEKYFSVGITFENWSPAWSGEEKRFCQRIKDGRGKGYTFDVEIAHLSGPIKLCVYKDGKSQEPLFFENSIGGIESALQYAKDKLLGD